MQIFQEYCEHWLFVLVYEYKFTFFLDKTRFMYLLIIFKYSQ